MDNRNGRYGVTIVDVLLIVFIVLKLCKVIDWPWLWVLSPLWISLIIVILILLILSIVDRW